MFFGHTSCTYMDCSLVHSFTSIEVAPESLHFHRFVVRWSTEITTRIWSSLDAFSSVGRGQLESLASTVFNVMYSGCVSIMFVSQFTKLGNVLPLEQTASAVAGL